jgi:uncharacterized protein Yka (UPF0111/DUF47 family)
VKTKIALAILIVTGLILTTASAQTSQLDEARDTLHDAIAHLQEAERSGAHREDIEAIAESLDQALNLLEEANDLLEQGDPSQAEEKIRLATAIIEERHQQILNLRDVAQQLRLRNSLIAYGSVAPLALATTWIGLRLYNWWRRRQDRKLLKMIPRIKKTRKEEED